MAGWREVLGRMVVDAEKEFDRLKYRLAYALGGPGPIKIVPYRGYGTPEKLYLKGRVLEDQGVTPAGDNDSVWKNLVNMYKRLESDEVPHARLLARFQDIEQEVVADEEGMFDVWFEPVRPLPAGQLWHEIDLELLAPRSEQQEEPVRVTGQVLVPPPSARFVVISDIDDTVLQTDATHFLNMARNVFLGNARTRLPFPGVAAFYRALHQGPEGNAINPLLYVSSSPWNFYDLLSQFFQLRGIPIGPVLFLRNWGISEGEGLPLGHRRYKLRVIKQMLDMYRALPFILIGDSGQEDPEIYAEVVNNYPGRILAVYVRNVSRGTQRPEAIRALAEQVLEAGSVLILADNTLVIAKHAAAQGWIDPAALPEIEAEKASDEAPPDPVERLLGEEGAEPGETVIVEGR